METVQDGIKETRYSEKKNFPVGMGYKVVFAGRVRICFSMRPVAFALLAFSPPWPNLNILSQLLLQIMQGRNLD